MAATDGFSETSEAVQFHLSIMQAVIQRMSGNSASCKAWCITLVAAIFVVVSDKGRPQYTLIAVVPTLLFFVLDSYYLALERSFRNTYEDFVNRLHEGSIVGRDLYYVASPKHRLKGLLSAAVTFSVALFYITVLIMIGIVRAIAIAAP